ncbi:solute carrier family 35 member G1 isoform X1 [Eurytemora carolleeae]|uniref:solute carrier family 35 member G1 isoform X1 n=1 Tax=Eurytemora carolleeae TaxID=1294199 RepID=UPI000C78CD3E|nr:solute carrier family 35 member G1 isoform X1 [Eurytemora carolleeae]|eukprot:XP_023335735.1 solute carrier family 35 member G1-like isoform X1 [Eurytemora affinis]
MSFKTFKSSGLSHGASFRSCISRQQHGLEQINQGFYDCSEGDGVSFYSVEGAENIIVNEPEHTVKRISETETELKKPRLLLTTYTGYFLTLIGGILYTASSALINLVPEINPWTLIILRCLVQLILMVPVLVWTRTNPLGPSGLRLKIIMQGIVGGVLLLAIYLSINRLPTDVVALFFFSVPGFAMVLSAAILKEHFAIFRAFIILIVLSGTFLLIHPTTIFSQIVNVLPLNGSVLLEEDISNLPTLLVRINILGWPINFKQANFSLNEINLDNLDAIGIIASLSTPILTAYLCILMKQCQIIHFSVSLFWTGLGGLGVSVPALFILGQVNIFQGVEEWCFGFLIGALGLAGNMFLVKGACMTNPGKMISLLSVELVTAYILQISVFKTYPTTLDIVGAILVAFCLSLLLIEDFLVAKISSKWF